MVSKIDSLLTPAVGSQLVQWLVQSLVLPHFTAGQR